MMLTSDLAVYDHKEGDITLIANVINWDGSTERVDEVYDLAIKRLDKMESDLSKILTINLKKFRIEYRHNLSAIQLMRDM